MPPDGEDKRQQFIEQDRIRSGTGPSTLRANTTVTAPSSAGLTARPSEEDGGLPVAGTGASRGEEESPFPWKSYEEGIAEINKRRISGQKMMRDSAMELAKRGVVFDNSGDPKYVYVQGVGMQPLENIRNLDSRIAELIQDYESGRQMLKDSEDELKILESLKKGGYFGEKGGIGKGGIDEDEEFRKRVKFYADIAKDIMSLQRAEVDMNIAGVKGTADIMAKIKENKILVPGQQVYVPTTPNQNLSKPLQDLAGIQPGILPGVSKEIWNDPNAYAKALGVPGYAAGTKPNMYNKNTTGRNIQNSKTRFSTFMNRRRYDK